MSSGRLVSAGKCLVRCRRRQWVVNSVQVRFLLSRETLLADADSIPALGRTLVSVQRGRFVSLSADYVIVFLRAVLNSKTELGVSNPSNRACIAAQPSTVSRTASGHVAATGETP